MSKSTVADDLLVGASASGRVVANRAGPLNGRAVKHGALSHRLVEPRARELVPGIVEANPHLDVVRDGPAVLRYCVLLARCEMVYRWLDEQPDPVFADSAAGRAHGVFGRLECWERAAGAAEIQLAISPLQRSRLGLDLLQARRSLEDELEEGREAWRRRELADTDSEEAK